MTTKKKTKRMPAKRLTIKQGQAAAEAVQQCLQAEFNGRSQKGYDPSKTTCYFENGVFALRVDPLWLIQNPDIFNPFSGAMQRCGQTLQNNINQGVWKTANFDILKKALNENFLREENKITFEL